MTSFLNEIVDSNSGLFISGQPGTGSGKEFPLINPANGQTLGVLAEASTDDVDKAVESARQAWTDSWWATDTERRIATLRKLAEVVEANAGDIAYLDAIEAGKVVNESLSEDVPDVVANLRFFANLVEQAEGRFLQGADGWGWIEQIPVGVVGCVLPWNYPIAMLGWKVAPALAAGNALVIKPSEESTLSALYFARLAIEAGVPEGIVNVISGQGAVTGQALGLHNDVDALTFTGSGPTGRRFLNYSAESNLKAVSLELGGRAGYLVDAEHARDFDTIASDIVGAAFGTSGQNCTASSRIIFVGGEPDDFGKFTDALVKAAQDFTVGDPFTDVNMGPVINQRAADRIKNWVEEATKAGAEVLYQGPAVSEEGSWVSPTLISEAPSGTQLSTEEIFGPVSQVLQVSTREEAVERINGERYGLASTIWCEDVAQMKWWANQLRVGTVAVNGYSEGTVATPFGGLRESGFWGRDNGPEALRNYQETKTVWVAP